MSTVEVDLDDLEALIFAASAIKQIEGALSSFRRDPFVKSATERFIPAQKRLESVWRNAKRAMANDTLVKFDEPLSDGELAALRSIEKRITEERWLCAPIAARDKMPKPGEPMSVYDRLVAKGCVEIGQQAVGMLWPGADMPELALDPTQYFVRITKRGYEKIAKALAPPA